jgi:hypothetical protein
MMNVVYEKNGPLIDGEYLPGEYAWSNGMRLRTALLTLQPPTAGVLTLTLEVGGSLTPIQFTIEAQIDPPAPLVLSLGLGLKVPANTLVRWVAAFTDIPEAAAMAVSLTMTVDRDTAPATPHPGLRIDYCLYELRLPVFTFNPDTQLFFPTQYRGSAAQLFQGTTFDLLLEGSSVFRASSGVLMAASWNEGAYPFQTDELAANERLEFLIDHSLAATAAADGVYVPRLTEGALPAYTPSYDAFYRQFAFGSGGEVTAILSAEGLSALALAEPIP